MPAPGPGAAHTTPGPLSPTPPCTSPTCPGGPCPPLTTCPGSTCCCGSRPYLPPTTSSPQANPSPALLPILWHLGLGGVVLLGDWDEELPMPLPSPQESFLRGCSRASLLYALLLVVASLANLSTWHGILSYDGTWGKPRLPCSLYHHQEA